jgi:hypothetical protein
MRHTEESTAGACVLAPFEPFGDLVLECAPGLPFVFNCLNTLVAPATGAVVFLAVLD